MDKKLVFIALPLSVGFKNKLRPVYWQLKEEFPQWRWLPEEKWHLTVMPPCDWSDAEIKAAAETLREDFGFNVFRLESEAIVLGPPGQNKRMVWVRFKTSADFIRLKKKVLERLKSQGVPFSDLRPQEFIHLTLARFEDRAAADFPKMIFEEICEAGVVELWQTIRDSHGSEYRSLASFKFL